MPELPRATETDSAFVLGTPTATAELPTAVDDSLELVVERDTVPAFSPVSNPGAFPGEATYPGDGLFLGEPYEVLAPNVATGTLSMAVETDVAFTLTVVAVKPLPAATEQDMALPLTVLVDDAMFADAIEGIDRTPAFTLKADWGRTGLFDHEFSDLTDLVEEVTVERTLTGELPPEVGLVDGTTSATMSVSLAGRWSRTDDDGMDPVDVFAPYRPDSPLYGAPTLQSQLRLETGFVTTTGPRLDRRFTGTVAQINPASLDRTVQVTGLDASHRLRRNITLSGAAMYGDILQRRGPDAYRSRFNTQWLIDHILRQNGIYASPPARDEAILSVTGHGSMIPEVGWGGAPTEYFATYRGEMWQKGKFGPLATIGSAAGRWWVDDQVTAASGTGFGLSMWLGLFPADDVNRRMFVMDLTTNASVYVRFGVNGNGFPYVTLLSGGVNGTAYTADASGGSWAPPPSGQWQFVGAHVSFAATTMTVRFRIGGALITRTVTIPTRPGNWKPSLDMAYNWLRPVHNFQLWPSATPPGAGQWQGETWTPQADLDPGANELTGIPEIVGEDSMELIKEICAAEGSTFEFTEEGRARFRTRVGDEDRGDLGDVTERITAEHNLADLVSTTDESSVRNIINVKTKTLTISAWQDYYVADGIDAFYTPAQSTNYFELELPTAAYELPPPLSTFGCRPFGPNCWSQAGGTGFIFFAPEDKWSETSKRAHLQRYLRVMVNNVNQPTAWVGTGVQIRVVRLSPWKMQVIVNNQNTHPIRFSTPREVDENGTITNEGEPAFIIPARILEEGEEQLETYTDNDSVDLYGPSSYDVGSSGARWRQFPEGLRGLASSVLASTANPVPVLEAVDVPHDPRRRLRNRVVIEDPDGLGSVAATVVGISTTFTDGPATDQLTVRPIAPPGLGLLGDATVGLLGINLVLG